MNISEYFIEALHNGAHKRGHWRITAFSRIKKVNPDMENYDYRVVPFEGGYAYYKDGKLSERIEGSTDKEPLLVYLNDIELPALTFANQPEAITTKYGNVLLNSVCILDPFGTSIDFVTGRWNIGDVDKKVVALLVDNDPDDENKLFPGKITCTQLDHYVANLQMFEAITHMVSHAATPRSVLPPTGIEAERKRLQKIYTNLNDPVEAVKYENALRDFDTKYLEGDPSLGIVLSGKNKNTARVKMYMAMGSEPNFTKELQEHYMTKALNDGGVQSKSEHSVQMSGVRAGSYFRGVETQIGGTGSKIIIRALNYVTVSDTDCGTKRTLSYPVDSVNVKNLNGLYHIVSGKPVLIEAADLPALVGKVIERRTPIYCTEPRDKLCKVCAGERLYRFRNGMQLSGMDIGNTLIYYAFKKMKGVTLSITDVDLKSAFT